ncbi:uncharacterized protein LOC105834690 [Monomorium pharaonis]|uniref:uncharacterized protein LOC105834690 n=1 Tax=Monomorium pharaonis TaxID=307658 RepID=UPI00102E1411|nr:uncharacterized protein LOC105834690 [Monomorium pharaonis]
MKKSKLLVARKSERRSLAMINNELQDDKKLQANKELQTEKNLQADEELQSKNAIDVSQVNEGKKESFIWPDEAVLLFLEIYRNKESEFASGLKRHNKIWTEIASEMKEAKYNITAAQCHNKMSGLKRTYKNISNSNKKSGNHASSWAFYSVMNSMFGQKTWIEPVAIASSDGPQSPESSSSMLSQLAADEPKSKKRRLETILKSFVTEMKKNKQKETEDRERRITKRRTEKKPRRIKLDKKG